MVNKLDKQAFTSELESHWIAHSYSLVPRPSKKLYKLQLLHTHTHTHTYIYIYTRWLKYPLPWEVYGSWPNTLWHFLLDLLKEQIYSVNSTTLKELKRRIRGVMYSILQEFLVKSTDAVPGRFEKLGVNAGTHTIF